MNRSKYIRLNISPTQAAKDDLQINQIIKAVHLYREYLMVCHTTKAMLTNEYLWQWEPYQLAIAFIEILG